MKIAPSLLSCDFAKMGEEIEKMDKCGADYMHLDVMDAHFVPNLTFGAPVIKAVRSYTEKPFDVHLMISEPLKYIDDFAKAGADIITFHVESDSDISKTIDKITENGIKPGLVIKPNTPASAVFPYLDKLFMVLVMTVEPGFGGQGFMADMLPKVQEIKAECAKRGLDVLIEADGGISTSTIKQAADAGVAEMEVGEKVNIHLMPEEAYGMPDPNAIFTVAIAQLPGAEEVEIGQQVYLQNQYGQPFPVKVTAKDETNITFDANHEMAGKELNFEIELVEVK